MSKWHNAYYDGRQCSNVEHRLNQLGKSLETIIRSAKLVPAKYLKGSHSGRVFGCVTRGFLVHCEWCPSLQVVLDVVYYQGGVSLQLAAYEPSKDVTHPPPDHALVENISPEFAITMDFLEVKWNNPSTLESIHERKQNIVYMLEIAELKLENCFAQLLAQMLEKATP